MAIETLSEKYNKEFQLDVDLTLTNLKEKTLGLATTKHKWLYRLSIHKTTAKNLKRELEDRVRGKELEEKQLANISTPKLNYKINNSSEIISMRRELEDEKELIQELYALIETLKEQSFDIRAIVDQLKFEQL